MKSVSLLFRPFVSAAALWIVPFLLLGVSPLRADVYDHSGTAGDLQDGHWLDQSISPPNVFGNPGPADDAYFYGAMITGSGGSVHLLSGDHLSLSGTVTAVNVGVLTSLSGAGVLNAQTLVTDANGFSGVTIEGGHLNAQNGNGVASVTAGGTVTDATCSGTTGCGIYDQASSLTITGLGGPGQAGFFNGSTLTANGGLTNFGLNFQSGSTGHVSSITNGIATVNGVGSSLMVTGDFSLNAQSVSARAGGVVTVNGTLTQNSGAPVTVMGSGSTLTAGQFSSTNGGDMNVTTGGAVTVQGTLTKNHGQVSLDGSNSKLTVLQDFSLTEGILNLSAGAALSVNGELTLDGNGSGHWQGASTMIQNNSTVFVSSTTGSFFLTVDNGATVETASILIGRQQGSTGSVNLSGAGTLWHVQAQGLAVGRAGTGTFHISDQAHLLLDPATAFAVGFDSGSNGTMTLDGNGSVVDATGALVSVGKSGGSMGSFALTNQASLLLGQTTFIGDGGNGNLSVGSGSHTTVTGDLTEFGVGNLAGSTGSLSVQGTNSSFTTAGPMIVGVNGNGFLDVGQGAQMTFNNEVGLKVGEVTGANGHAVVDGQQTRLVTKYLAVGSAGTGQVTISNGGELNVNGARVDVGAGTGGDGTILVTGTNSFLSAMTIFPMTVGGRGKGTLSLAAAGQFDSDVGIDIAVKNGSTGAISVSDAGSLLDVPSLGFGDLPIPGFPTDGGAGTITVQNSGQLRVRSSLNIRASTANPSIIISNGEIGVGTGDFGPAGSLRISENGVLVGNPRGIQGQVIVGLGGRISPGNSPGLIAINGDYRQEAGSTFLAEIGGTDPGTGYDQITATGTASFGGNLTVRLINGFTPTVGQTFRIVSAASASGAFDSISQPSQAGISLTSDASGITVTITSVVPGAPVISSATTVNAAPGAAFSYQIAATNSPTSFGAMNLPAGLTVDNNTGLISGTPVNPGTFIVPMSANNAAGSGQADLTLIVAPISDGGPALPPSNLLNIATRMRVQTGDNALIGGFIITGTDPKKVIIRGIGPSLSSFINGTLADPTLELFQGSTLLVSNDNWKTDQQAEIEATGIPPTNDLESAIVRTLTPGSYTAILRGKDNTTGIGVVEAYDLDLAANSTLANISTRGLVETGDNVMIGGLIVGPAGRESATVVVRAIGPALGNLGISGALQDPTLDLVNSDGVIVRSNNDWRESQEGQIIAAGLAPSDNRESALIETLAPGSYTAIVRGAGGTTGIGLVEAYHLP